MKIIYSLSMASLMLLWHTVSAFAQNPPGWAWAKQIGVFTSSQTARNSVAGLGHDAAGNLYLAGNYVGTPIFDGLAASNLGESDVFIAKYSPGGSLIWLRALQSTGIDVTTSLAVDANGRCTLTGNFGSGSGANLSFSSFGVSTTLIGAAALGLPASNNSYEALSFVVAIDATGNLLWAHNPSPTYGLTIVATHLDSSSNCYVSANTSSQSALVVTGQNHPAVGVYDAVLIKYNSAGQPVWTRRVGTLGGYATAAAVKTDNSGAAYWLVGHSGTLTVDQTTVNAPANGTNSLVKLSAASRVRWIKNNLLRVGTANAVDQLLHTSASDNTIYLSCNSSGGAISFDSPASPLVVPTNTYTGCVARCDTAGQIQWVKPVLSATNVAGGWQGPLNTSIKNLIPDASGYTVVTSTSRAGTTTFSGFGASFSPSEGGLIGIAHFNGNTHLADWVRVGGVPASLQQIGGEANGSTVDSGGNVFVAGAFAGTARFGGTTLTSATIAYPEIFFAKLDQTVLSNRKAATGLRWALYPNPARHSVTVADLPASVRLRLTDAQGRTVRVFGAAVAPGRRQLPLSGLAPGLYLLHAEANTGIYMPQKLLIE
ncbi:T9SS type A sorting domain-containing protein [Hymenobacter psychrotolerans]|uniref:Por secretion system C-terminal sorting domain-containing protein n=1 Tax=Hymenobacter psychrotolerans DSM 18569 TaxID=1121959 RepID=A0A1M7C943_9BACT|nr:T9SS type A sorting domain-containing protein [Hymenobacter psychrotolerans]SHL63792.1 Por secretion system C-terminal sorting domain-containing protein [Hymenobacter psychrotolerans DSM 18569]